MDFRNIGQLRINGGLEKMVNAACAWLGGLQRAHLMRVALVWFVRSGEYRNYSLWHGSDEMLSERKGDDERFMIPSFKVPKEFFDQYEKAMDDCPGISESDFRRIALWGFCYKERFRLIFNNEDILGDASTGLATEKDLTAESTEDTEEGIYIGLKRGDNEQRNNSVSNILSKLYKD